MDNPMGPTGEFPNGKLNAEDEGALQLGVAHDGAKVILNFGVPVKWIGLEPQGAADLASALIHHAREAARSAGVVLTLNV